MAAANKLVGVAQYPAAKLQLDPVHQLGKHLHSCPRNSDRTTVRQKCERSEKVSHMVLKKKKSKLL